MKFNSFCLVNFHEGVFQAIDRCSDLVYKFYFDCGWLSLGITAELQIVLLTVLVKACVVSLGVLVIWFRARYWRKYHCSAFLVAAREFYCLHSNDWTCEHDLYCHFRVSHNLSRSRLLRVPLFQSKETWIYKEGILFSRLNSTSKLFSSGFFEIN